ncbi:ComEC/Rec2 family competence protein [Gluconacetobacter sacchari]|uniref:ComEC/Rec2 family competence protein n=1 Tax=Gluconacetobacter sacchari TaxID=92759 RepID=UPI0039B604CC
MVLFFKKERDLLARLLLAEQRRLALWLPVGLGLGIAWYFSLRREPGTPEVLAWAGVAALGLGWIAWRPHALAPRLIGGGAATLAVGCLAAFWATHRQPPLPDLPARATIVIGRVAAVALLPADGPVIRRLDLAGAVLDDPLDAGMPPLRRILRVRLRADDPLAPVPGMVVRVRALLRPPAPPSWPGGPDRQRRAYFDGTAGGGTALGRAQAIGPVPASSSLEALRERISARIVRVLPGAAGGVATAVLTGSAVGMARADRDAFADAGLAHLLAVAGLHLGIVMGVSVAAARLLLACSEWASLHWPCRSIAAVAGLVAGILYVGLTGAHLPALRSLTMAALVVLAIVTGRRALLLRGLAVGAILLLLTGPADLLEAPLQMSLVAVMALAAAAEHTRPILARLTEQPARWRRGALHAAHLAQASLLAGGATVPVVMAHFGTLQPWFVLANLLAVPLMAMWVLPLGLLSLFLMPLGFDSVALVPMGWGIGLILDLARMVSGWPAARLAVPAMPDWGLALWMLGLSWLCLWAGRWRAWGMAPMALALAVPFLVARPDLLLSPDGRTLAVRDGAALRIGPHPGSERLVEDDWRQALALPVMPLAGGAILPDRGRVALRLRGATPARCDGLALLVTLAPDDAGCPGARMLDSLATWKGGAQAVFLRAGGPVVVSDRDWRGARPWVLAPGQHGLPVLPMAQRE